MALRRAASAFCCLRCLPFAAAVCVLAALPAIGQTPREYVGKLQPELVASRTPMATLRVKELSAEERETTGLKFAADQKVFGGRVNWAVTKPDGTLRGPQEGLRILLVEAAAVAPVLYVDVNGDERIAANERFVLERPPQGDGTRLETTVPIEERNGPYRHYPLTFAVSTAPTSKPDERYLSQSIRVYMRASVDIAGRPTLVQFSVDGGRDAGRIDPRKGFLGVDGNGDGVVDVDFTSPETAYAQDEDVVFRAGDRFVSVKSVDQTTGAVILVDRPAADYVRIDMRVGATVPDFSFTDFSGASRKLSEFRGKYLLLDFWGSWCGPCVADIPYLKAAHDAFRDRGFEILGIDGEATDAKETDVGPAMEKARKLVAEKGVDWPQATTASVRDLYMKRFRITAWPTLILLDPEGKILSTGGKGMLLRGDELKATLDRVLPRK